MDEIKNKVKISLEVTVPGFHPEIRHKINVELDFIYNSGVVIRGQLPAEHTRGGYPVYLDARGRGLLDAVVEWLGHMDSSMDYLPHYDKGDSKK